MFANLYQIAGLVDNARLTDLEKVLNLRNRDFLLPLEAAGSAVGTYALDGDEALVSFYPYADCPLRNTAEITLGNAGGLEGGFLEVALDQEFAFYFLSHNYSFASGLSLIPITLLIAWR